MLRSAAITGRLTRLTEVRLELDGNMNAGQRDAPHSADLQFSVGSTVHVIPSFRL